MASESAVETAGKMTAKPSAVTTSTTLSAHWQRKPRNQQRNRGEALHAGILRLPAQGV